MAPFDPNSLAAILQMFGQGGAPGAGGMPPSPIGSMPQPGMGSMPTGQLGSMPSSGQAPQAAMMGDRPMPLGMVSPFETNQKPGFVGRRGEGLTGAELPGMEGLSTVPGHDTMMAAAQNGDGAKLGLNDENTGMSRMAAILGMKALGQMQENSRPQAMPTLSTGAAPRGQQVQLSRLREMLPTNTAGRGGMSSLLFGGR